MDLQEALVRVVAAMEELRIPYALAGGLASNAWVGEERAQDTYDVDFAVAALEPDPATAVRTSLARRNVEAEKADPMAFRRAKIHRLWIAGITVDFILPRHRGYPRAALDRTGESLIGARKVRVLSPEDAFLYKALSKRERDLAPMSALAEREDFDRRYAERWARRLGVWRFAKRALRAS